jgi:hypothetical protein
MLKDCWIYLMRYRPENPKRLQTFKSKIQTLGWSQLDITASLSVLFAAVDDLAEAEVKYYYRRRGTRAWVSGLTRISAWLLGSVGLLLPLIAGANSAPFPNGAQYGYVFLAAAASCLAANSLFGGTDGHIRFVSTQLKLEKIITVSRVQWCQYLSDCETTKEGIDKGFNLILGYANDLHEATMAETGRWGDGLLAELAKYRQSVETRTSSGG